VDLRAEVLATQEAAWCLAVEDVDHDGLTDVVYVDPGRATWHVRWGRADGTFDHSSLEVPDLGRGACALHDLGGDGDLDLLVALADGSAVLEVGPQRSLTWGPGPLPSPIGSLPQAPAPSFLTPIDLDHRGEIDFLVGYTAALYDECGFVVRDDMAVELASDAYSAGAALCLVSDAPGSWRVDQGEACPWPVLPDRVFVPFGAAVDDLDRDGHADLVIANDFGENTLLLGTANGLRAADAGHGLDAYNHGMGVAIDDYDLDGRVDVFISDVGASDLYTAGACRTWFRENESRGLDAATGRLIAWGVASIDLDRNGAPDVFMGTSAEIPQGFSGDACAMMDAGFAAPPAVALINDGRTMRRAEVDDTGIVLARSRFSVTPVASGDLDEDGDVDVVVSTDQGVLIVRNHTPPVGRSLRVRVVNDLGVPFASAEVIVRDEAGHAWRRAQHPGSGTSGPSQLTADIGLGAPEGLLTVEVRFPDGSVRQIDAVDPDRELIVPPLPAPIEISAP
jgi:hypothetical protein